MTIKEQILYWIKVRPGSSARALTLTIYGKECHRPKVVGHLSVLESSGIVKRTGEGYCNDPYRWWII